MSQQLISRSADLRQLQDAGYEIEVRASHLLVKNVPYVDASRKLRYGVLVSTLDLAGDVTMKPSTHVTYFVGEPPCDKDGTPIAKIVNASATKVLAPGLEINHTFSSKPAATGSYADYYEKMTTYVAILSGPAEALDSRVNPRPFRIVETSDEDAVFRYMDTASSRAGIGAVAGKLELPKVALVGVGGTGSYVLDLVSKTPVREIHLFDGDRFGSHNAFRSPGAATIEELRERPTKVDYLAARYSAMHRRIVPHPYYLDKDNTAELAEMDFAFLCVDAGPAKRAIVQALETADVPFIDVGMGVHLVDGALLGILRVTTSTRDQRDHVRSKGRIPFSGGDAENEYDRNIQVADLNALTAALAVIRWKKLFGFYHDRSHEFFSTYTVDCGMLLNEDRPC